MPSDWVHPDEGQRIEIPYPRFTSWRESFGQKDTDWYLPVSAVNSPPYPVISGSMTSGPGSMGTVTAKPIYTVANSTTYYQLQIQEVNGLKDPDGDQVFFRSGALPAYMSLDASTGLVTIAALPPAGTVTIGFWSEDTKGASTSATPYTVIFSFVRS